VFVLAEDCVNTLCRRGRSPRTVSRKSLWEKKATGGVNGDRMSPKRNRAGEWRNSLKGERGRNISASRSVFREMERQEEEEGTNKQLFELLKKGDSLVQQRIKFSGLHLA